MSTATRVVCDQCHGVIPSGAQCIRNVNATLTLTTGPQAFTDLDFCCTSHMAAYVQAQPPIPDPAPLYPVIPS